MDSLFACRLVFDTTVGCKGEVTEVVEVVEVTRTGFTVDVYVCINCGSTCGEAAAEGEEA